MKIFYGIDNNNIDVTSICFSKLNYNNIITIPSGETSRSALFTDPTYGILKKIIIFNDDKLVSYEHFYTIKIDILNNTITTQHENDIISKLENIHSKLNIKYGNFKDELPEQKMITRYLTGNEKVLEIGGNIGRTSLIVASILENNDNFVTLECDVDIANKLTENRDLNNFKFHIENSALSNRKLIQLFWDTIPSDELLDGYTWVNTISLNTLKTKYNIEFDTLILDCEGAFYYILKDMPEILNNINLIIMENDYKDLSHKQYIDEILTKNNFNVNYVESGGWWPCFMNFFEVWKKKT
jgi:FkbM family methyltransferase